MNIKTMNMHDHYWQPRLPNDEMTGIITLPFVILCSRMSFSSEYGATPNGGHSPSNIVVVHVVRASLTRFKAHLHHKMHHKHLIATVEKYHLLIFHAWNS